MITVVKQYITCEGRFFRVFRFHMRFLLHLLGMSKMNLPYFLFSSLAKMSRKVQKNPNKAKTSLIHHSLISILVLDRLREEKIPWEQFLIYFGFEKPEPEKYLPTPIAQRSYEKETRIIEKIEQRKRETRAMKRKRLLDEASPSTNPKVAQDL